MQFRINSKFKPSGDQPEAIERLMRSIQSGNRYQTLLGVTGSGKTFTVASLVEKLNRQTLIISPNKTLAAQLYREFKEFFPENKVEFFISYYDYYQPEAYIPTRDIYVEKEAQINEIIEKMRLSTMKSVITRRDVIVVASVSCIYASGDPEDFKKINLYFEIGKKIPRREMLLKLAQLQYERSEDVFKGGTFRLKGEILEVFPSYEDTGLRVEFFDDEVDRIYSFDPIERKPIEEFDKITVFPATEYITSEEKIKNAISFIETELQDQVVKFKNQNKLLEAQRIEQRTRQDLEMLSELGYCTGIENYSRYFDGRNPGDPPWTLMDYFDKDYLLIIDESHITVPQIGGMNRGDLARKVNLVDYGFRLPSAYDNRPLKFEEFEKRYSQVIFTSATPGKFEMDNSHAIIQQIIRPTGLVDPEIEVRKSENQIDDLLEEIRIAKRRDERVLVLTLTKSMAERLSEYLQELGIKSLYLHSELGTVERVEVLRKLRIGEIEVIVGINLLREGLDLPEVSLVAILDADKEGFLRSETTLIQIVGRAARNVNGRVLMYADKLTPAMNKTITETNRRRKVQMEYNEANGITPESIKKAIDKDIFESFRTLKDEYEDVSDGVREIMTLQEKIGNEDYIDILTEEMEKAAKEMRFEDAAKLRDKIFSLKNSKK